MVYLLLASGFEETEAIVTANVLRRAGINTALVGIGGRTVVGTHGITMLADCTTDEVALESIEMLILPGGTPGTKNLYESAFVKQTVRYCIDNDCYVAAICAAPSIILGGMGVLAGKKATCYPGMEDGMTGAIAQDVSCCVDGKIITGRAAGASFDFALALCAALRGEDAAQRVRQSIFYAE